MTHDIDAGQQVIGQASNLGAEPLVLTEAEMENASGGLPIAVLVLCVGAALLYSGN